MQKITRPGKVGFKMNWLEVAGIAGIFYAIKKAVTTKTS